MPVMLELKAEELAKKQTKLPSQDLASAFFKLLKLKPVKPELNKNLS